MCVYIYIYIYIHMHDVTQAGDISTNINDLGGWLYGVSMYTRTNASPFFQTRFGSPQAFRVPPSWQKKGASLQTPTLIIIITITIIMIIISSSSSSINIISIISSDNIIISYIVTIIIIHYSHYSPSQTDRHPDVACVTKLFTLLDLCVSSLRRGHAILLCIVPSLTDDPRRESDVASVAKIRSARGPPFTASRLPSRCLFGCR